MTDLPTRCLPALREVLGPMTSERKLREVVRVVVEEMRKPTEEMIVAGVEMYGETEGFGLPQQLGLVFGGMMYAALSPEEVET